MINEKVVSKDMALKLKEAGYEQDGKWWWVLYNSEMGGNGIYFLTNNYDVQEHIFPAIAPTELELQRKLSIDHVSYMGKTLDEGCYRIDVRCEGHSEVMILADTEANCRAKAWIHLKKKGLM